MTGKMKTTKAIRNGGKVEQVTKGGLTGLAATWDRDLQGERISIGAFKKTIREALPKGIPLLVRQFAHGGDIEDACGRVVEAKETPAGLLIRAEFLPDERSQAVRAKMKTLMDAGISCGLSIGYSVVRSHMEHEPDGEATMVLDEILCSLSPAR